MSALGPVDLLIRNGLILTMDPARRILHGADLAVRGTHIAAIGRALDCEPETTIDAGDSVVLPGLVDAHMHETLSRGINEDLPLDRWLAEICFPVDSAYTADIMRASALMSQMEMIRAGITTFLDIWRFPGAWAGVAELSGLRAIFAPQVITDPVGPGETVESAEAFVRAWAGRCDRIIPAFGPHAPYSVSSEAFVRMEQLAETLDVPLHTHLAETQWEVQTIRERHGDSSPAAYLDRLGILTPRLSVAHGVHLSPADIELLRARDVSVVYNPSSNMKLASGTAPVPEMQQAGVRVGLGTDSNLSNNNLDMFEEMRAGAVQQKLVRGDAAAMFCYDMLAMATTGSAGALRLEHLVGSLEVGKKADIILVDLNQPHLWPLFEGQYENIVQHLVYSANAADVSHTIVDGRLLMENRRLLTIDMHEARDQIRQAANELLARAGLQQNAAAGKGQEA